jgi:hypothetical protein
VVVRKGRGLAVAVLLALLLVVAALVGAPVRALGSPPSLTVAEPVRQSMGALLVQPASFVRVGASTSYVLDLDARQVHVRHDITLTNQQPDIPLAGGIRRAFLPDFGFGVPAEAAGFAASRSDGRGLEVDTRETESPMFHLILVDLDPDLYFPDTQQLTITYDLPRLDPRVPGLTRINEAFATFPVYGIGDPGRSSVEVLVPDHLDVELVGDEMTSGSTPGYQRFFVEDLSDPDGFFTSVVARDDSRLVRRDVDLGDDEVEVLGWPDDPEWADFVAGVVGDGVPALEELIGLEWPADELEVVETVAPYLYGYAGWFTPSTSAIEVGDELDPQVILHELSHLWFNGSLFRDRWINEALAEEFSGQALVATGRERPTPVEVGPAPEGLRLNAWGEPDLQSGVAEAQEAYGYAAGASLLRQVVEEVGVGPLAAAVRVAAAEESPYRADEPTPATFPADWRTLLDLLQEVSGSTVAEPLFRELVVAPEEVVVLDERAQARVQYARLAEVGAGWAPPQAIRTLMAAWRFDEATALMPATADVLADRSELAAWLAEIDQPLPPPLEATYEQATDLDVLDHVMASAVQAAARLRDATADQDGAAGPIERVGLLFQDLDGDLADAAAELQSGDYDDATRTAAGVTDAVDHATRTGVVRLLATIALWLALLLARRARRHHREVTRLRQAPQAAEPLASEADGTERVGSPTDGGGQPGM